MIGIQPIQRAPGRRYRGGCLQLLLAGVVLWVAAESLAAQETQRVLLLSQGPDGHPQQTHEYVAGMRILAACLAGVPGLEVTTEVADGDWPAGPERISQADTVVLFLAEGAKWVHADPLRLEALAQHAAGGGGCVALHWAIGTREARYIDGFLKLFGGCHGGPDRKYKFLTTDVRPASSHELLRGIGPLKIRDEFYYQLKFVADQPTVKPILKASIEDQWETVAWAWERSDGGRSFGFSGLHYHENWQRPEYRRLVTQAVLWTLKRPIPQAGQPVDIDAALYDKVTR